MIRDRISYTAQNLEIARYEHLLAFLLGYKGFMSRPDTFAIFMSISDAESEENYLHHLKRLASYVKLVEPRFIRLYEFTNKVETARGFYGSGYYLHLDYRSLSHDITELTRLLLDEYADDE